MQAPSRTIRWGILGTGYISRAFAEGLRPLPGAQLVAIASRTPSSAQQFAREFGIARAYGSYGELVQDAEVDVVYIGTPNSRHRDDCLLCLGAGKPVLCEKPFAMNAREASEVIEFARKQHLFCMEAMWMRFLPLVQRVRQMVQSGAIGEVCTLTAEFGYPAAFDPSGRLFNRELGGGALLDRGVYPLSLAYFLVGEPESVVSQAAIATTGVDEQSSYLLKYASGQLAMLSANLRTYASNEAVITGTRGQIRIHAPFYKPHQLSVTTFAAAGDGSSQASGGNRPSGLKQAVASAVRDNSLLQRLYLQFGDPFLKRLRQPTKTILEPYAGNGYGYEAAEVMRCLRSGEIESRIMPLDETLAIQKTMDEMRRQWGLAYPQDEI
ncbi:Gfo/Idh/MocA family oxidoreductase [Thermoleptolyngbya sp. M55_K2018_002]|uniref:Gfo/Idh/MocA family protein n=1 Tax=Thermoleptolyngbya sp. M55_K2018_002 TaxID=2747808 RepID=UPI0019F28656|nr:Gfo/Idh/MocA family oxidoreductase [Thermoleptolyngbya sp. M55_K2018_002]HIK41518.1 Gfo/Idh/MocA family oxidoreductase [Thermoleptolyngbya sp. M55_K2018_002]